MNILFMCVANSARSQLAEGLAAVAIAGKWGYINLTGKRVAPLEFDQAFPFAEGLGLIKIGDRYGYITKPT